MSRPAGRIDSQVVLRQWREEDRSPFAALNADAEVMRYFPSTMTREESDSFVDRASELIEERGWGLWAVEVRGVAPFVGFVGLNIPQFMPDAVEIGWRLAKRYWGRGYAPNAARQALRFGFEELGLPEIVSFTSVPNAPSRRVMEKIGMTRDPARDFDHPNVPDGPLKRHVFYCATGLPISRAI